MTRSLVVLAAVLVAIGGPAQSTRPPDVSTRALVTAATAYVTEYQQSFAFLIADETYKQARSDGSGTVVDRRVMKGELFLTYLPIDGEWIAVHDIAEVDGEPVPDRDDLRDLLHKGAELRGMAAKVVARNARYNIGTIDRNFNEPTLPLLIFEARRVSNLSVDRTGVTRDGAATIATLSFRERGAPTLVRGRDASIRATGDVALEAGSGRIRRTRFLLRDPTVRAELETFYAPEEKLGLWVPSIFRERYEAGSGSAREVINCEAVYTNYRRFAATGRIK
jgi:hypothetical protein